MRRSASGEGKSPRFSKSASTNRSISVRGQSRFLTFGGGVHYCLGANLARREIAEALNVLTQRLGNPRTAGPVPWKPMATLSGPKSLPIEFEAV